MTTAHGLHATRREPDWVRTPPHVHTYPNPPMHFRQTPAEKYTSYDGKAALEQWRKERRSDEFYRFDNRFPMMHRTEFNAGVTKLANTVSYEKPALLQEYLKQGSPVSETVRARALNRVHWYKSNPLNYQFTNAMTSTQYQRPVTSVYGPMLRDNVYGLHTMHNRHGFMPSLDYY